MLEGNLYTRFRPRKFSEVVGCVESKKYLINLIKSKNNRNLILAGDWGCGKTTLARLFAKGLNCLNFKDDICCECRNCKIFDKGEYFDYMEVDAASKGGLEELRKLESYISGGVSESSTRILVIDECHSLSPKGWDFLLKVIEETYLYNSRFVFLFLTTELSKVRNAIKSRCDILNVSTVSEEDLKELTFRIVEELDINITEDVFTFLLTISRGHVRDFLVRFEQLIIQFNNNITKEDCLSFYGLKGLSKDEIVSYILNDDRLSQEFCLLWSDLNLLVFNGFTLQSFNEYVSSYDAFVKRNKDLFDDVTIIDILFEIQKNTIISLCGGDYMEGFTVHLNKLVEQLCQDNFEVLYKLASVPMKYVSSDIMTLLTYITSSRNIIGVTNKNIKTTPSRYVIHNGEKRDKNNRIREIALIS